MPTPLRVLILEDRPPDAELMATELCRAGFSPNWRRVETEAAYLEALEEPPDVILADYHLPEFTASRALHHLQSRQQDLPFIIVTGVLSDEEAVECLKGGATDYVLKGQLVRLGPAVARALKDKQCRTERSQAELRQAASERKHRELINSLNAVVWEAHPETFTVTYISPQVETLLGYPKERWLGSVDAWAHAIHPDDRDATLSAAHDGTKSLRNHTLEYRMIAADGRTVWVRDMVTVVVEGGRAVNLCGVLVDITKRKEMETQLRQAQKMEAVGLLAGGIAHDFNNMLTVIIGHTDMIISRFGHEDPLQSDLAEIKSAGQRAAALTQQLLAFSRRQFLQPHVLDLNAVIADIIKMLRRLVSEHIELVMILDPGLARVKADRGQLEQIIMNLVVNARDVLPQGGRISITTGNVELDEGYVRDHAGAKPGPYVMLAVGDTGPGMDAETQTHIFEPFFTTKEMGKGTGLGLATVYGIIKQSGGYIEVDSAPGKGATFRIYLPQTKEAIEPAAPAIIPDRPLTGTETVLLVEDEDQVRKFILMLLQKHGYTVFEAGRGEEALRICDEHQDPIHLLFSDMVMPGLNGRELAIRVMAIRPETRVLLMSAYTRDAVEQLALMAPGTPFLKKPFSIESLLRKVREVLDAPARDGT